MDSDDAPQNVAPAEVAPACPVCGSRTAVRLVAEVYRAHATGGRASTGEDDVGDLLAPPVYPVTWRSVWVPRLFLVWFTGLMVLAFLAFVPQSMDVVLNWRLLAWTDWWRALTWAAWGFGLAGVLLALLYVQTPRTDPRSVRLWNAAHYCPMDDLVFIPGYDYTASPAVFHHLIREQPYRWLLRGH
ncbi:MAG TPA: hypothetical protein VHL09_00805 [Dehalococcoidia bacterium]|nr:hypothetical protein [Dehalococcoidia bacterium]